MTIYQQLFNELFDGFFHNIDDYGLTESKVPLSQLLHQLLVDRPHGDLLRWYRTVQALPDITNTNSCLNQNTVQFFSNKPISEATYQQLETTLKQLSPWRHGPFNFFNLEIETEWLSCMKWQRLQPHIQSLKNRRVLDVGCGSGYFIWRMLGEGAKQVIGIDPTPLMLMQFAAAKKYAGAVPAHVLPIRLEQFPEHSQAFDTVFSMGVLYHRKQPIEHLKTLKTALTHTTDAELVLETLIIDEGDKNTILTPVNGRYAGMPNVWSLPSIAALKNWLVTAGFNHIDVVSTNKTTADEQRKTCWIQTHSLQHFLQPDDSKKTIEITPHRPEWWLLLDKKEYEGREKIA